MNGLSRSMTLLFLAVAAATVAQAADWEPKLIDRWEIELGGFFTRLDTNIRFDAEEDVLGTPIDFEEDLNFDDSEILPRITVSYLIGRRHQLRLGYYQTDREASGTVEEEFEWGGVVFPIDFGYRASFDITVLEAAYTFYFMAKEKTAAGIVFGLLFFDASAGIGLEAFGIGVGGQTDYRGDLPVPQIGLTVRQMLPKRFVFSAFATFIAINNIDDISADLWNTGVAVEHRTFKNFGFGLGYNFTTASVESQRVDTLGKFELDIGGLQLYLRFGF